MSILILSGGGYSGNWLPLIYPLLGIVILLYGIDYIVKYFRKRRLLRENQLINELHSLDAIGNDPDGSASGLPTSDS